MQYIATNLQGFLYYKNKCLRDCNGHLFEKKSSTPNQKHRIQIDVVSAEKIGSSLRFSRNNFCVTRFTVVKLLNC